MLKSCIKDPWEGEEECYAEKTCCMPKKNLGGWEGCSLE